MEFDLNSSIRRLSAFSAKHVDLVEALLIKDGHFHILQDRPSLGVFNNVRHAAETLVMV